MILPQHPSNSIIGIAGCHAHRLGTRLERSVKDVRLCIAGLWKQRHISITMAASRTSHLKIENSRSICFPLCECIFQYLLIDTITTLGVKTILSSKMTVDSLYLALITTASLNLFSSYLEFSRLLRSSDLETVVDLIHMTQIKKTHERGCQSPLCRLCGYQVLY